MKYFQALLFCLLFIQGTGACTESSPYPLWDGFESAHSYARAIGRPDSESFDLGSGITLKTMLIPAGEFVMGTPEPPEPTEKSQTGRYIMYCAAVGSAVLVLFVFARAVKRRMRPAFSLRWLLAFTTSLAMVLYGGVRSWKAKVAWREFASALARFSAASRDEKPAHPARISRPFYMGIYEVTHEQYQQIAQRLPLSTGKIGVDQPVDSVSWFDARHFCELLSVKLKRKVRLPTEAEWEYAARAGTVTRFYSGDEEIDLKHAGWCSSNSAGVAHPVGLKDPNAFGLFDILGNAAEWCGDWYGMDYYSFAPPSDPAGVSIGLRKIVRGGSFGSYTTVSQRDMEYPDRTSPNIGFRVVVELP